MALIDIDDLAGANEAHGHDIGDVILFVFGGRARYALGEADTLALIADKVNANPFRTDTGLVPATISVGAAPWPLGGDFDETCAMAGRALLSAKGSGGARLVISDEAAG